MRLFLNEPVKSRANRACSRAGESSDILLTQVERKARYFLEIESLVGYIFLSLAKLYYRKEVFCVDSWIQTFRTLHHLTHGVI